MVLVRGLECLGVRRLLAKLWVMAFALSYTAAAIASHCQSHFDARASMESAHDHHAHGHAGHHHAAPGHDGPAPSDTDGSCAAMTLEKVLGPASLSAAGAPATPDVKVIPAAIDATAPWLAMIHSAPADPRPPPDLRPSDYAAAFARTGRLLI